MGVYGELIIIDSKPYSIDLLKGDYRLYTGKTHENESLSWEDLQALVEAIQGRGGLDAQPPRTPYDWNLGFRV